jgi:hypothetical protein
MAFQDIKRALKAIYGHSDSSTDEHHKQLNIMFGGSWDITSRRVIKMLRRAVAVVAPAPRVVPHHNWMETSIGFNASDCPKNMAGAWQLPLIDSPTIPNVRLYHVLIDSGTTFNLISLAAFQNLQIFMSKLAPPCPFLGMGPGSIIPRSSISLPVMFRTPENYCTESIIFDVAEVNLPFNAIVGRPALYQLLAIAHYGT